MNSDAIGYLQVGAAWAKEGPAALSAYWHPLYSLLLYGVSALFPSRVWDAFAGHFLNLALFVVGWGIFHLLARALANEIPPERRPGFLHIADAIYFLTSLQLGQLWLITPDFLVTVFVYLSLLALLRTVRNPAQPALYVVLGLVLAAGYWTKAIMFHYGILLFALLIAKPVTLSRKKLLLGFATFLALASVHALLLSKVTGKFAFTVAGRTAYLLEVNHVSSYDLADRGEAAPAIERILQEPSVYKAATLPWASHLLTYDPSVVLRGVSPGFDLNQQLRSLQRTVAELAGFLYPPFLLCLVALVVSCRKFRKLNIPPAVIAAPLSVIGLYLLVYIERRYLFPFLAVGFVTAFACIPVSPRWMLAVLCGAALTLSVEAARYTRYWMNRSETPNYILHQRLANALTERGLKPGEQIGIIGHSQEAYFAHLLGAKIVAEAPTRLEHAPWKPSTDSIEKAANSILGTSARAIVVTEGAAGPMPDWEAVPETPFYFRLKF